MNEISEFVRQRKSMSFATIVDGEVRVATGCFAADESLVLYTQVFRDSVRHRGVLQHPQVAVAIDDGFTIPMRGVEIIGTAEIVDGEERQRGEAMLNLLFPELESVWTDERILVVRITPDRVRFTDWTHGAGHSREELIQRLIEPLKN